MRRENRNFHLVAVALILALAGATLAQENPTGELVALNASANTRNVPDGQMLKVTGIVTKSNADSFTLREPDGTEIVVMISDTTKIKAAKKNWLRRYKTSGPSSILRGLRLEAEGRGNQAGELVAAKIRFNEQDFRTAQALESRVDPVETLATSTKVLAESNQERIAEAEQNAERLTVHFRSGSAQLSPAAKAQIDAAAFKVHGENLKGWVIEVVGHTDSMGNTARNRSLSERRADAVINYLVITYTLPLRRVVQPFGYGSLNPVADNATGDGRSLNRRVEIRVLVNKGLSSQAGL